MASEGQAADPYAQLQASSQRAQPIFDNIDRGLLTTLDKLWRKFDAAAAIQYALNLWPARQHYSDNGIIKLCNSATERKLPAT